MEADDLYGLPLERFTAERDALAARLRGQGNKDGADAVKKLRKPSVAAWAVNRVVRTSRDDIERLFALRDRIEGATTADEIRTASEERRRLITDLVARAGEELAASGHAAGANAIQAITQTFQAGDTEEDREALRTGRLTRELVPTGFGGFEIAAREPATTGPDTRLAEKQEKADELAAEADEAEAEADRLEAEVEAAKRAWARARALADAQRKTAEQARKHAERARAEVDRLRA